MLPAIRAGLVQVWGIDPKRMELAFGRRIFDRYSEPMHRSASGEPAMTPLASSWRPNRPTWRGSASSLSSALTASCHGVSGWSVFGSR
jgi:hypothetical protein